MNIFNLFKKRKSQDSVVLLQAPTRANKAYPYGKGVGVLTPVIDLTTGEYLSELDERKYLSSLGYEEVELKLFDYDHKLFYDYCLLMYDKEIGKYYSLSPEEKSELSFFKKIELLELYKLLPELYNAFEKIKADECNE